MAAWLGVSVQWLEIGRVRKYGPEFTVLGPRCIRYTREQVRAFLRQRAAASTAEYRKRREAEIP